MSERSESNVGLTDELGGWQPITTCPREETVLFGKWHDETWFWVASGMMDETGAIFSDIHDCNLDIRPQWQFHQPNLWRPMFPPPNPMVSRGGLPPSA